MTILHVTPYYAPAWAYGPVPAGVAQLARAQASAGHQVTVLTTDAMAPHERLPPGESTLDGVRVIRVPNISGSTRTWFGCSTPIGMRRRARQLFRTTAFDVVHLHELVTIENLRVGAVIPATVPIVVSMHGQLTADLAISPRTCRLWSSAGGRRLRARIQTVVAGSTGEADALARPMGTPMELLGGASVRVLTDGVDLTPFTTAPERGAARDGLELGAGPVVLVPGPVGNDPSTRALVEALGSLLPQFPSMRLVCAGTDTGGHDTLAAFARSLGVDSQLRVTGYVAPSLIPRLLAAADLVVVPLDESTRAAFIVGAMALGRPLLGTPVTLPPDGSDAALCLDSAEPSPAEWAAAIRGVLTDDGWLGRLRDAGRRAAARLAWPAVASSWDELYEDVRQRRLHAER